MPKFTNISTGDRGLYTKDGLVMVPAGATVDVELAANEDPNPEWFDDGEGEDGLARMTKAQLLEIAASEGVTVEAGANKADIVAAIELTREGAAA